MPAGTNAIVAAPAGQRDRLIGRTAYMARILSAVALARHATPVLVEVVGEPGIGKSRLLTEAAMVLRAQGMPVVAASGDPLRPERSFGMMNALLCAAGDAPVEERRGLDETDRRLRDALGRWRSPVGGPVVLLDELQHADLASLQVLARLLQAPPDGLAIIVAYRPRQNVHAVGAGLSGAVGVRRDVLELTGLSQVELAELLGVELGPDVERVHARTGGNPLYAAAYRQTGSGCTSLLREPEQLAADIVRLLGREIGALPADERQLASAMAVLGDGCDPSMAPLVARIDPEHGANVLDRLVVLDILRADRVEEPGLRFRHPIVCAAVYQATEPGRRRRMHAIAGRLLRDLGQPCVTYAEHVARSAPPGDVSAVRTLHRAAQHWSVRSDTAVAWLSAARRLLPDSPAVDGLRARIWLDLAAALVVQGRLRDAHALLQELACNPPDGDDEQRVTVALARANVERLLGRPHRAHALLHAEISESPPSDAAAAMLLVEAAVSAAMSGRASGTQYLNAVQRLARSRVEPRLEVRVHLVEAFLGAFVGGEAMATDALARATIAVDAMPDGRLAGSLDNLSLLAWTELMYERDRDALRHFDQAIAVAAGAGHEPLRPHLLTGRGYAANRLAHLHDAARDGLDAEALAQHLQIESSATLARTLRAEVMYRQVGAVAARPLVESASSDADARPPDWFAEVSQRLAARLRHQIRHPTGTMTAVLRGCGDSDLVWVEACNRAYWAGVLADMARGAGRPDEAEHWVEEADRHARRTPLRGQSAYATMARARHVLNTEPGLTASLAAEAVGAFAELGWLLDEASARLLRADALCSRLQWRLAEYELAEVRRVAVCTESQPLHQAVVSEQRRIGGCAGRAGTEGSVRRNLRLTRRESDVVGLVTEGVSNAVAADRLHITEKTVEAHLTRIFRKAGVSSRMGLVAALAGTGGDTGPAAGRHASL